MPAATLATAVLGQAEAGDTLSWWQVVGLFVLAPMALFAVIALLVVGLTSRDHQPEGVEYLSATTG